MAESNMVRSRIVLPKGQQKKFIETVQTKQNASIDTLAKMAKGSPRTLRDWKREKFLASYKVFLIFSRYANIPIPKTAKRLEQFWYVNRGALAGGKAIMQKYGRVPSNEDIRKKKWYEWWNKVGRFNTSSFLARPLHFRKPRQSTDLAEFFGIMIGDGGMTDYQIIITLHHTDDLAYSKFVIHLIKKLFDVSPKIYHRPKISVNNIAISRSRLIVYLKIFGLVTGNKIKQQLDIPDWIKNRAPFLKACIRGLVDTDGCIIRHKYAVNNKKYSYKKLSFTSMSKPLRETVFRAFKKFGLTPTISQNRDVRLHGIKDMGVYFSLIGSHNPKHLNKYYN